MKIYYKTLILIFILFISTSCGYKTLDYKKVRNINLNEVTNEGNKSINFKILSQLKQLFTSNQSQNEIYDIHLISKENVTIKEKNKKNEITKYEISIKCNLVFKNTINEKKFKIDLIKKTNYRVDNKNLKTIQNKKKAREELIASMSEEIIEKIVQKLNDI